MRHYTTRHAKDTAISVSTFGGAALGTMLGAVLMLPPVGPVQALIGPWAMLIIGCLLGGAIGYFAGPLFSKMFRRGGSLRRNDHVLSSRNPVTGRSVHQATSHSHAVGG